MLSWLYINSDFHYYCVQINCEGSLFGWSLLSVLFIFLKEIDHFNRDGKWFLNTSLERFSSIKFQKKKKNIFLFVILLFFEDNVTLKLANTLNVISSIMSQHKGLWFLSNLKNFYKYYFNIFQESKHPSVLFLVHNISQRLVGLNYEILSIRKYRFVCLASREEHYYK